MLKSLLCFVGLLAASLLHAQPAAAADEISGVVRDSATLLPLADVRVTLQATEIHTTSAVDGSFTLLVPGGFEQVVVGARKGYFNGFEVVDTPNTNVNLFITPVPQDDDPNYEFVDSSGCSFCHFEQVSQWENSPMARTGLNAWVYDLYSGTGTPGGMNGFVYTRDSIFAQSHPDAECASCHQPERWIANGEHGPLDPNFASPSEAAEHGVSCDMCHKIADVNVSLINSPGFRGDAVTVTRPAGANPNQVQYGVLGDVSYVSETEMRASYNPQIVAEACGVCHQDKNDPDGDGNYEEPNGVVSQPTYLEWLESPYGDPESPMYASCVDCHMPPSGSDTVCTVLFPPLLRDPNQVRSHRIVGTTPEFLENTVELVMNVDQSDTLVTVDVDITNAYAGHRAPTGVALRNMILLVEAWAEGDDPLTDPLVSLGTQVVHELGGVGDPAQGYYAGLPGKLFANVNEDAQGNGPTLFTEAVGLKFDTRIDPLATDSTSYSFLAPANGETVNVRARLIYRRAIRATLDTKGWTTTGLGEPLVDLQAPHFGFLMESAQTDVQVSGHWSNLGFAQAGTNGAPVLQGAGPFTPDSHNSLLLSNALEGAQAYAVIGLSVLNAPFKGGVMVPTPEFLVPLQVNREGNASFNFLWRANLPVGLQIAYQMWIQDAAAPSGYAASNGLQSTSQP